MTTFYIIVIIPLCLDIWEVKFHFSALMPAIQQYSIMWYFMTLKIQKKNVGKFLQTQIFSSKMAYITNLILINVAIKMIVAH